MNEDTGKPEEASAKTEKKNWGGKWLLISIAVGVVVAGVTFCLPLVFATKKESTDEDPPESQTVRQGDFQPGSRTSADGTARRREDIMK